jgi:hypothetical protein
VAAWQPRIGAFIGKALTSRPRTLEGPSHRVSEMLVQQAANNTKEQFSNSPDLKTELRNALMEALDAHTSMSSQALNSRTIQAGILDILAEKVAARPEQA